MKIRFKPRHAFRESLRKVLRFSWKKFLARSEAARDNPNSEKKLHRMRIAGKRLRDIMELCLPFSNGEFKAAYGLVKESMSLLGKIHDLDDAGEALRRRGKLHGIGKITRFIRCRRKKSCAEFLKSWNKLEKLDFEKLVRI